VLPPYVVILLGHRGERAGAPRP